MSQPVENFNIIDTKSQEHINQMATPEVIRVEKDRQQGEETISKQYSPSQNLMNNFSIFNNNMF